MGYRYKKNNSYADLPDISDLESFTGGKGIRGSCGMKPTRENYSKNYSTYGSGESYGSKEDYNASTRGRGGLPIPVGTYNTGSAKDRARHISMNRNNSSRQHPNQQFQNNQYSQNNQFQSFSQPKINDMRSQNRQYSLPNPQNRQYNRLANPQNRNRLPLRENFKKRDIQCIEICDHIKMCPICSKFYNNDKTIYVVVIVILCLILLILLKKVLKV